MSYSKLPRSAIRAAAGAVLGLLFLACVHQPKWDTDITVPILSRTFLSSELLDSALFRAGPDSVLELHVERTLDTVRVGDRFGPVGIHEAAEQALGDFGLASVLDTVYRISVMEMLGLIGLDSALLPIPPFRCELPFAARLRLIERAEPAGGYLVAQVDNRSLIRLDTVQLDLAGIGALVLGPVDPGDSAEARAGLAEATLDSLLAGDLVLAGLGSGGDSVWVHMRDSVFLRLAVDSLRLRRGRVLVSDTGQVSASWRRISRLRLEQPFVFDSVGFASGAIGCTLSSSLPLSLVVRVGMFELGFDTSFALAPYQELGVLLDLSNRWYRNPSPDSNQLTLSVLVGVVPTPEPAELESAQALVARIDGEIHAVNSVAGAAKDTAWGGYCTDTLITHLSSLIGRAKFAGIWLSCAAANASNFTSVAQFRLGAYNPAGESAVAETTVVIGPGAPEEPTLGFAVTEVARIFNVGPDRLYISRRGGAVGRGSAGPGSFLASHVVLEAPFRAALHPDTFRYGPRTVRLDSIAKLSRRLEIDSAEVAVRVVNHLPAVPSGELLLWVGSEETVRVKLGIPAARLDSLTGRVVAAGDSLVTVGLNRSEAALFRHPWLSAELRVYTPETDTITVMSHDYFQVDYSYARLKLRIGGR